MAEVAGLTGTLDGTTRLSWFRFPELLLRPENAPFYNQSVGALDEVEPKMR